MASKETRNRQHDPEATRRSWNQATQNHNAHKGDQAAFFRRGGDTLFEEELALLGALDGARLVHLQCNSGQDTLSLARRGANAIGVDLSDEAIAFARTLSDASGIAARFERAEVVSWLHATRERFDVAFASYGVVGWLPELAPWAEGVARVLEPGGHFVYVEFHPVVYSVGEDLRLSGDDYFAEEPFLEPVRDYVAASDGALFSSAGVVPRENPHVAASFQHGLGETVTALAQAGLRVEACREYPHANGCRVIPALVRDEANPRRWVWPEGAARLPLMFGLRASKPR
jgi:SAM-dependent methyltransferase